ncbi:MAG: toxin-antitoxin system YwqK family antitoxin, partial [Bacteroidota bacterium]
RVNLKVTATLADGRQLKTRGAADGKTHWDEFKIEVQGGEAGKSTVSIGSDPRAFKDHKVIVTVSSVHHPSVSDEFEIPVSYKGKFSSVFTGASGRRGSDGARGADGSGSGGQTGGNGRQGGNGGDGGNGPHVESFVTAQKDPVLGKVMLLAYSRVKEWGSSDLVMVDPDGGQLWIVARGGAGGDGGSGGTGGQGSSCDVNRGMPASPGGSGGDGGDGGNGGTGGTVTVYIDPSAEAYKSVIHAESQGGRAGSSGSMGWGGNGGSTTSDFPYPASGHNGNSGRSGGSGSAGPAAKFVSQKVDFDLNTVKLSAGKVLAASGNTVSSGTRSAGGSALVRPAAPMAVVPMQVKNPKPSDGYWKETDDEDKILSEGNFKGGRKHGEWKTYHKSSGKLRYRQTFAEGELNGKRITYNEKDIPVSIEEWVHGDRIGIEKKFYDDGTLRHEGNRVEGDKVGLWKYFHENGQVEKTETFDAEGELNGYYCTQNEEGHLKAQGWYKAGKKDSLYREFWPGKGLVRTETGYAKGKKHGPYLKNHSSGEIAEEGSHKMGKKDGAYTKYWDAAGKLIREQGQYANNKKDGAWKSYTKKGGLKVEENYAAGKRHGSYKEYHPVSKKLVKEGEYEKGKKVGDWKEYD